ncbi:MAG: hypothetical protein AB7I19_03145 [Planctomycetota bacterium]
MKRSLALAVLSVLVLAPACNRGGGNTSRIVLAAALTKVLTAMSIGALLEQQFLATGGIRDFTTGQPTQWSSSTLGVADKVPNSRTDIQRIGAARAFLSGQDIADLETAFPLGQGGLAYRLDTDRPQGSTGLPTGFYNFFFMDLLSAVPLSDTTRHFQYAAVGDRDGESGNNYQGQAPFDRDFFNGTDTWFQLLKAPQLSWRYTATSAINNVIQQYLAHSFLLICEDILFFAFLASEFTPLESLAGMRATGFEHGGDFGQQSGDWSGSVRPERSQRLFTPKWSALKPAEPQVKLDVRFLEVSNGFLNQVGIMPMAIGSYVQKPAFRPLVANGMDEDAAIGSDWIGGFATDPHFIPTGLGAGGLGVSLTDSDTAVFRSWSTLPGPRRFRFADTAKLPFTASLTYDYRSEWYGLGAGTSGELFGEIGGDTLFDQLIQSPAATVFQVPELTAFDAQRSMIQFRDATQPSTNLPPSIADEIAMKMPGATSYWVGPQLDFTVDVKDDLSIGFTFNLDSKNVNVVSDETLSIGSMVYNLNVPFAVHGDTQTTEIVLQSGQSLLISGVQETGSQVVTEGIPYLKDIPVLNRALFQPQHTDESKQLMVLIRPTLIHQF